MRNRLFNIIIVLEILMILLIIIGIIASPHYIKSITLGQSIFAFLLINVSGFILFSCINAHIHKASKTVKEIIENIPGYKVKDTNTEITLFNIDGLSSNLQSILENLRKYIKEQNHLLKEYLHLNQELEKNSKIRDVIVELSHSVIEIDNIDELFNLILRKAISVIDGAEKGSLLVLNEDNYLEYRATVGFDFEKLRKVRLGLNHTFLWNKSKGAIKEPCIIRNTREFDRSYLDEERYKLLKESDALDIKATLSSPIIINGKLYGMLNIDSCDMGAFDEKDVSLMSYFANQVGVAIRNHQLIDRIMYLSRYDCLTNVYNRHYFEEMLQKIHKKALRYNEFFSIVLFDLDKLKKINDTFGHSVGDMVIQVFTKTISENIRETDLFARYGGDEFIAVFFNTTEEDIEKRLINIMEQFKHNPLKIDGDEVIIRFSYGISSFPDDSKDIESLFRIADERMYRFKNAEDIGQLEDKIS